MLLRHAIDAVSDPGPRGREPRRARRAVRLARRSVVAARRWRAHAVGRRRLRAEVAELTAANARLAGFAELVGHELAEPLAAATRCAEVLSARGGARSQEAQLAGHLHAALVALHDRMDAVQRLAGLRRRPPSCEVVDGGALVAQALERLGDLVCASGARVDVGPLPAVRGDRAELALMMENLLGNALRHGSGGGRPEIAVAGACDGELWHLTVADRGAGLAPGDAERVFEPFARGRDARAPGAGLGLALCRAVAERAGGRIWVEAPPGLGCTFHVVLPLRPAPAAYAGCEPAQPPLRDLPMRAPDRPSNVGP